MKTYSLVTVLLPVGVAALIGCAETRMPPTELQNARAELVRAKSSTAATLDPTDVHEADVALQRAERAFADNPDAPETVDLAVIAQLKALAAQSEAQRLEAVQKKNDALAAFHAQQEAKLKTVEGA